MPIPNHHMKCEGCSAHFTVHYYPVRRPFCPNCGSQLLVTDATYPTTRRYEHWTLSEEDLVYDYLNGRKTVKEIARTLKRTEAAVRQRANLLRRQMTSGRKQSRKA